MSHLNFLKDDGLQVEMGNCLWEWEAKKGSNCWVFRGENNCIELVFKTDVSTKGVFQQVWNSHIVSPVVNPTAWVDFMVKSMVLKLKGLQKTSQVFQNHFVIPSGFGPPNLRVFFEPHHLSFQFRLVMEGSSFKTAAMIPSSGKLGAPIVPLDIFCRLAARPPKTNIVYHRLTVWYQGRLVYIVPKDTLSGSGNAHQFRNRSFHKDMGITLIYLSYVCISSSTYHLSGS